MPVAALNLQPGLTLSSSSVAVYTAEAGTTVISGASVANPGTASAILTIGITRSGGTSMPLVPGRAVPANSTNLVTELNGRVLNTGDVITASGAGLVLVMDGYSV